MKKSIIYITIFLLFFVQCQSVVNKEAKSYPENSIQSEAHQLLSTWVDTMLQYQFHHPNSYLDGGIICPACARIHGRCGDVVLPLMYMADFTKDEKYLKAAKRLMLWMDNVRMPDGSWMNDVNISDWSGTTVFFAIALGEALLHHGHLLDDSTRNEWRKQLLEAGEFIYNNQFIYSRKREGMCNMNINYSASAIYALYLIGNEFDRMDAYLSICFIMLKSRYQIWHIMLVK